jgi:hypothetical protein
LVVASAFQCGTIDRNIEVVKYKYQSSSLVARKNEEMRAEEVGNKVKFVFSKKPNVDFSINK